MGVPIIGSFSNDDGDGNENVQKKKKSNRFIEQNNKFERFFVHFFAVFLVHNYDVKMPNFTFYGRRKQASNGRNFLSVSKLE